MENFMDEKLDKINKAGDFIGRILGRLFKKTSKGVLAIGILSLFGLAVFIWGIMDGIAKDKNKR